MNRYRYTLDKDGKGNLGFRIDSDTHSLVAWFPVGFEFDKTLLLSIQNTVEERVRICVNALNFSQAL